MDKIKKLLTKYRVTQPIFWPILLASVLTLFSLTQSEPNKNLDKSLPSIDTLIPKGFSFISIQVKNYETLDQILGPFGVVDLYPYNEETTKTHSEPIAKGIKIIRNPANPHYFGVLVPEDKSDSIMKFGTSLVVVVQSPHQTGTDFVNKRHEYRRPIVMEN